VKGRVLVPIVAVGLTAAVLFGTNVLGQTSSAGVKGTFSLLAMVHTTTYEGQNLESKETVPWDGSRQVGGPFVYAAIPCRGNAPLNNISTDLTTYNSRIPGSRSPASTRSHPLRFRVIENDQGKRRLKGRIVLTACRLRGGPTTPAEDAVPDAEKPKIYIKWYAKFRKTSPEEVKWMGTFRIIGGTGLYEDLTGEGEIAGYFFCFAPEGCDTLGEFRDGQYTMSGRYQDPTYEPVPVTPPSSSPSPSPSGSP